MTKPKESTVTRQQRLYIALGVGTHTANIIYQGKESSAIITITTKKDTRILVYRDTSTVGFECLLAFTIIDNNMGKASTIFTKRNIAEFQKAMAEFPPQKTINLN
jgi:hypothetical protein